MTSGPRIAAVVLAAGDSRRMGQPKALLRTPSGTFLERVVALAQAVPLEPVRVVVGRDGPTICAALPALAPLCIHNPEPELGQLHSLRLALASLPAASQGAAVLLVDHPFVRAETITALVAAFHATGRPIVVPSYQGQRGHPVLFARCVWEELVRAPLEVGARAVVASEASRVLEVAVEDAGILADIDTPEAFRQWVGV
jgi:molybdenum cofactor cytidylyltransferase